MCKFFSALVTQNDVLWDKDIDSHTELLTKFGLIDSDHPDFVKVELTPIGKVTDSKAKNWTFKTDQDLLPDWYNEKDAERQTRKALKQVIKQLIVTKGDHKIESGRLWAFNSATVEAFNSATVEAFDSATVEAFNSATVEAFNSTTVKAFNSTTVKAYGSTTVKAFDSATVKAFDSATVKACNFTNVIQYDGLVTLHDSAQKIDRRN